MLLEGNATHQSSEKITMDDGVPYLEMKSRPYISSKENVPVEASTQPPHKGEKHDSSLSMPFSNDFERTKQKCQQDFRLDYRRHVSQRKESDSGQTSAQPQELSLPIRERRSAKARLRDERNREYNAFLKQKGAQAGTRTLPDYLKSKPTATTTSSSPPPPPPPPLAGSQTEPRGVGAPNRPRRDAATLTDPRSEEAAPAPAPRRHWGDGPLHAERRPRRLRSYYVYSDEDLSYEEGEEGEYGDEDEELEPQHAPQPRRQPTIPRDEPAYSGKRDRDRDRRGHQHRADRVAPERRVVQAPILRAEEVVEESRRTLSAMHNHNLQAEPAPAKTSERSRSAANKNMADFSTGLIIGACEGNVAQQRRKERYRQELLEQMAEQQKNKKKEKELELRVAASGAVDPEKQPDRIKQFGAVTRNYERRQQRDVPYRPGPGLDSLGADPARKPGGPPPPQDRFGGEVVEERAPPDTPRVAFQSPPLIDYSSSLAQLGAGFGGSGVGRVDVTGGVHNNDEFHRNMAGTLGDMITPRVTGAPPPAAPVLPDAYRTPYDEAYYYYGARNPLDPSLAYYGPGAVGIPPYSHLPLGIPAHLKAAHAGTFTQVPGQLGLPPSGMGVFAADRSKQSKDSAVLYQEQLRQQEEIRDEWRRHFRKIRERQERRMREREEQDRYDARLEAEMKTYEPWGRGGGGAPLKDHHGNLISDLKRMHRVNEEAYLNPESRWDTAPSGRNAPTPRDDRVTSPLIMAAGHPQGGVYARGNVFKDVPTPQQLQEQDRYKEYLMQQIAEKRRKEAEERERQRMEEEKEEKRLLEQRAQIQKEYEEEQERRRRKEMEQMAKNEELVRQAEERREEAERRKRQEEERASEALRLQHERERQARLEEEQRAPSPPIPTLQKLLGRQRTPRPPSGESQRSAGASTARSLSAPHSPPVPACKNQLRARGEQLTTREEKQNVISELSALSRQLRNEQKRLERQKLQTEREEMDSALRDRPKERTLKDVFDMARLRLQVAAKRPGSKTQGPTPGPAPVNMQNIHDFNQLRNRASSSREEVRQAYPEPPYDDGSLEIQQQALLRQQQRKLQNMKKEKHTDYFDLTSSSRPSQHQRLDSAEDGPTPTLLQSESAFIDSHAGVFPGSEEEGRLGREGREGRGSARERRRHARKMEFQKELEGPAEGLSVRSPNVASVRDRNQQRLRRLDTMSQPSIKSGELCPDDDDFWQTSPPLPLDDNRRVSVDTVATEPWLRPGTADSIKHFLSGPFFKPLGSDWQQQQQQQQGPSTYHG
ncbi:centrosome and spindle pole-associated protein 1 isoform X2 [Engraulis encrasicolus]|uniref:centrosome and spindle pole-associated protein 1 isoform X2 n=1 Tax=Engraulis encrasicolus TaxID=184585 RepID=UPI002FD29361